MTQHKLQPQIDELNAKIEELQTIVVALANQLHALLEKPKSDDKD